MSREEWEAEEAKDPGEPPVPMAPGADEPPVEGVPSGEEPDDFPDAQIIVDEQTGQAFIAFEIDPSSIPEEEENEGGEEK